MSKVSSLKSRATTNDALDDEKMKVAEGVKIGGYCSARPPIRRVLPPEVDGIRLEAIFEHGKKWANGTNLRYYFFDQADDGDSILMLDGSTRFFSWVGEADQMDVVRQAFEVWSSVGIGLTFEEVDNREEAEIRIGFMQGDGAWSYIGRDVLTIGKSRRTMNFGWDLLGDDGLDTALHEIGHTLSMPHEHQNPNAGIVWDEARVLASLAGPPNNWDEQTTRHNIINKLDPGTVIGSDWDRNSIMHYPFEAGMILQPEEFKTAALLPETGLSLRDKAWVKQTYPPLSDNSHTEMEVMRSLRLHLASGQQFNGVFEPEDTRDYTIQTFGQMDTVMTVFEDTGGHPQFLGGDDDSGSGLNARVELRMIRGRRYFVRLRYFFGNTDGDTAIMIT